jgi:hypothetical protein
MGKFSAKGGGAEGGGGHAGGKTGGGKRRAYDGLKFLERGSSDYQSQKKAKLWADKKHADKKRAALNRLLGEMPEREKKPISGVFDRAAAHAPAAPDLDQLDSASSSDCSLSDEEVGEGDIMFKDEALQRVWDPASLRKAAETAKAPAAAAGAARAQGKGGKAARLLADQAAREGPAAVGSFMDVPGWDASGDESGQGDEAAGAKKGGKKKAVLPEKITFGGKQRPEVLGVLASKANEKKRQIEQEKKAAQEAR